ncbi:MAG: GNAT family N-acetyltransferase [Armatimonadota bacterium]
MMSIIIRLCRDDDLPELQRLYQQLQPADTTTLEELARGFAAMSAHPGCEVFVAETEGRVAGACTLYILPNMTRNSRPAAILENIVVDEPLRGHGIGRAMLEFAREQAQARNCYKLSLASNAVRADAHDFYRRCGMTQHGLSFRYTFEK